ncbi:MAG: amidohydrolase/deacetylase family metallohydrolase [Thermodesulfobacteriota bacterium]
MKFDLLIKGGRVVDKSLGIDKQMDVGIKGDKIAEIGEDLNPQEARQVLEAKGFIVTAGLIDFHAHAFIEARELGLETEQTCLSSGVTTMVDAGSCGAANFEGFKEFLIDQTKVRLLTFLNISTIGIADRLVGECTYLPYLHPERTAEMIQNYPSLILGVKVRQQKEVVGENGLEPLKLAKKAAHLAGGLPVMVHVTNPPVPLNKILEMLEPGDIVSHFLHGRGMGILDEKGKLYPWVHEARKKGVIFDVAHGRNHLNFSVARIALQEGFLPDTISSDLTRLGKIGVVKNLLHCLTKFLNLGMDLASVLACATNHPARLLKLENMIGTLKKGAFADIAILALETGDFIYEDSDGHKMNGQYCLSPRYTISRGQVVWSHK